MKLTFIRADHEVTGSCTLLEIGGHYGLIDCGMQQGRDLFENIAIPVPAAQIEFVLVTHAHMDHTGHLPLLYKQGFRGTVYATEATCDLCGIMLRDAAHIQMSEAEWKGRKAARAGQPAPEPLYTLEDVEGVLRLLRPCGYGKRIQVGENIIIRFTDVGHLLGSACIEAWLTEGGTEKKIVFSGDIGNTDQPIIRDPQTVSGADYVLIDCPAGKTFRISPQSFYQVNSEQTERLYARALDYAGLQGTETVLDAYCGIGTIGLCAADRCARLIGVELNPAAVKDATWNAGRNRVRNAKFYCADAGRFLLRMAEARQPLDVLFMDPPRSGSDENFLRAVCTLAPKRVVYISCNPTTLARDLAYLTKHGFRALRATPVDMFPCTEHVETVVLLGRELEKSREHVYLDYEPSAEIDLPGGATYSEIKQWIQAEYDLNVSSLYVAQVKQKHGIVERECYNKPKSENAKQPKCPPEKEAAIEAALKHFKMI